MLLSPVTFHTVNKINFNHFKGKGKSENDYYPAYPSNDEFIKSKPVLKRGQVLDGGEIYISGSTQFFRDDIDWNIFSEYLKERFKDYNKVNTYDYACSEGCEAYSLSMLLQHKFKDDAEKFFPIYARDIDENTIAKNIENQKTGKIDRRLGVKQIAAEIDISASKVKEDFITIKQMPGSQPEIAAALKKAVTKPVIFQEANILDDIENIDSENPSIVMCRNMWPYVETEEYPGFASSLYERLKEGSIVVLGAFDCFFDKIESHDSEKISKALIKAGFEPSNTIINKNGYNLIFEKN